MFTGNACAGRVQFIKIADFQTEYHGDIPKKTSFLYTRTLKNVFENGSRVFENDY
jgi:hypothetical protein